MTDMIERVARAICARNNVGFSDDWEKYIPDAIASIKALREPTDEMVHVLLEYIEREWTGFDDIDIRYLIEGVVDTALGEYIGEYR